MAGSRRRRKPHRRRRRTPPEQPSVDFVDRLPPELLAEIHHCLRGAHFLTRLAFASICGAAGHMFSQEAPCLFLPGPGEAEDGDTATVFSLAWRCRARLRTSHPATRGHVVVLSSSGEWLVTADARGRLHMANPVTGVQAALPAITTGTIPFLGGGGGNWFRLDAAAFVQKRFGGPPPPDDEYWDPVLPRTDTLTAGQMRQFLYRKVVLSASSRPGSYAAMLITDRLIGAPAFATAEDPAAWRMAPSRDGIEDAIHHDGRFYSITCSGDVEAWDRDAETGEFTSTVVAPRLAVDYGYKPHHRKYLAAALDGRLMVVLERARAVGERYDRWPEIRDVFFKVQVLHESRGRWEEAPDIGGAALFVGVNGALCVPALEHRGIRPSCVYFTDDEVGVACLRHDQRAVDVDHDVRDVGMYSLKRDKVDDIVGLGKHPRWPLAAWFTPSFL